MSNAILYINHSTNESPLNLLSGDWIEVNNINDYFIFSGGSPAGLGVSDGDEIPSIELLNKYATEISETSTVIVPKYFLADESEDLLQEIFNAGNQTKRYAFAIDFDGATATEPQLEAWDNDSLNSYVSTGLGAGSPANSWYKAICTTTTTPTINWTGISLGGDNPLNVVLLNDGLGNLTGAKTLYFNFKIEIPGGVDPLTNTPVLLITYTTN